MPATGVEIGIGTATWRSLAAALAPGANTLAGLRNSLLLSPGAAALLVLAALPAALALRRPGPVCAAAATAD